MLENHFPILKIVRISIIKNEFLILENECLILENEFSHSRKWISNIIFFPNIRNSYIFEYKKLFCNIWISNIRKKNNIRNSFSTMRKFIV